jgi:hypothetical protein
MQIKTTLLVVSIIFLFPGRFSSVRVTADGPGSRHPFEFALIGDHPYDAAQEAKVPFLMADLDAAKIAFVIHVGDFKSGSSVCSDALFLSRYNLFQSSRHPFIYLFGDNEWTDCHRTAAGGFDPLERLVKLRHIFTQGNTSLGRNVLPLTRQSDNPHYATFRENVRWIYGEVLFVGFNIPGSNNNFPPYAATLTDAQQAANLVEATERNEANLDWLNDAFALAVDKNLRGIVFAMQANPFVFQPKGTTLDGYQAFLAALTKETQVFGKPVVLVHGDTHYFRIDEPLPHPSDDAPNGNRTLRLPNFTRVETFGSPDVHWVRGVVDTKNPALFSFTPQRVETDH